jgi:SAM-dependent methyltransferase
MDDRTQERIWNPDEDRLTRDAMVLRMNTCISYRGWQHTVKIIKQNNLSIDQLRVAEVGCGTGTFSLILGLLGASVTLIDFNQRVLEQTKKIYNEFGCRAAFIHADCVTPPSKEMKGRFDLVVSGGLAEHFTGEHRVACIAYHRDILKNGGVAYIGVPNKFSPFYQWISLFRRATKTWDVDVEVPFSAKELTKLARDVEFQNYYVLGNASLMRDMKEYSRGFVSAVVDLLPEDLKKRARLWKANLANQGPGMCVANDDLVSHYKNVFESIKQDSVRVPNHTLADEFSAGLVLFAFR